ncbi:MAG TPA: EVE domain-containing protein [Bacillota bacterium]|nr:EVE domain-containing protein [Bacillota bacterium]
MSYWLLKTEPESFSYDDLVRSGRERWNGVRNFRALKNMREMHPGDQAFIYHTGKEKAIVGVGQVVSEPYPDPDETDSRYIVIDVAPGYRLNRPVTLKEIKADPAFHEWELVTQPRLSVMPVTPEHWARVHEMAVNNY